MSFQYSDFKFYKISERECSIGDGTNIIANGAVLGDKFSGQAIIPSVVLDQSGNKIVVTNISKYCFRDCTGITAVSIPHSIKFIDHDAFYRTAIESLVIPSSVEKLGYSALSTITGLKYVLFEPGKLSSIGDRSLALFNNVKKVVLPPSVVDIGVEIFFGTSNNNNPLDLVYCGSTSVTNEKIWDSSQNAKVNVYVTKNYQSNTFGGRSLTVLENSNDCKVYDLYYKLVCTNTESYINIYSILFDTFLFCS